MSTKFVAESTYKVFLCEFGNNLELTYISRTCLKPFLDNRSVYPMKGLFIHGTVRPSNETSHGNIKNMVAKNTLRVKR